MSSSSGTRRVVRLGYVETDYPFVTDCAISNYWRTCNLPGINMVIWREIALRLNYDFRFVRFSTYGDRRAGRWDGLVGGLENATVDASLALLTFSPQRWEAALYAEPLTYTNFGFVRAHRADSDHQFSFNVYVFCPLVLLCIFVTILFIGAYISYKTGSVDGFWEAFSMTAQKNLKGGREMKNPVVVFGFLIIILSYQAGARSQRLMLRTVSSKMRIAELSAGFASGRFRLLMRYPSVMGQNMIDTLIGRPNRTVHDLRPLLQDDEELLIDRLCADANVMLYAELRGVMSSKFLRGRNCVLERLQLDDAVDSGTQVMTFGFTRTFPRHELKQINAIVGRIFTPDDVERYWFYRYQYDLAADYLMIPKDIQQPIVVSLYQLRYGYFFWVSGLLLAAIVHGLERIARRCTPLIRRRRRDYHFV